MAATGAPHACRDCGYHAAKWLGRCPSCEAWGTLEPRRPQAPGGPREEDSAPVPWSAIPARRAPRRPTGVGELDRALGGGLVAGSVTLLGGEPGIGKSTLLLQAASGLAEAGADVLYVSGEESASQLRLRGDRLGVRSDRLLVLASTRVEAVVEATRQRDPAMVVVDSIQAVRCTDVDSVPGSVAQVRESASRLVDLAKATGVPVLLVGHVTKEGSLAGPRLLEHVVDTVLQFEGERHHDHRILRALKNRFGPADELGVFRMTSRGLEQVADPSELTVAERPADAPGSAVLATVQGTRPLLVELQALAGEPAQGSPRRTAVGVDANRLALVLAVLERSAGLDLGRRDVFVSVAGGLSAAEPAADLAIAAALVSSARGRPLPPRTLVLGELGLAGEVRAVGRLGPRLREAERLGFTTAVTPPGGTDGGGGLCRVGVGRLDLALGRLFAAAGAAGQSSTTR